jgi:Holliday junction resolvase RusA-like endonuclease
LILRFVVNGPPVPCARARVVVTKVRGKTKARAFTPEKTADYETHVRTLARYAVMQTPGWRTDWGAYAITLRFYRAERRGDLDNFAKAQMDGLRTVAYIDDAVVVSAHIEMHDDPANPRAEVEVEMIGDETIEQLRKRTARERRAG